MLKVVFMGTAELACASLRALSSATDLQLLGVVSQPDKPRGRDLQIQPTPVKAAALAVGLSVWQPARARDPAFLEQLRGQHPELIVVAAYGQILPQGLLDLPRFGCLNVHTSLLPKYRGAAPIQCAILNGDSETGVTIMKMDAGLDTGPILTQVRTPIEELDNAQTLHDRLADLGATLLIQTIPEYVAGRIQPRPQPAEGASYAPKISKEDGRLDWQLPARVLWNRIRAFTPWPGAFTTHQDGDKHKLLKVWVAEVDERESGIPGTVLRADRNGVLVACGRQALSLKELQREGGRRLEAGAFLSGHPIQPGARLG
ncbi:MAG TPA: methionyl-tRNA formyltransferase [Verrucomicrobiae bacterium]|nr:methionyl-tRNA formyltransferase [Verrucomicrobiae bacterium]